MFMEYSFLFDSRKGIIDSYIYKHAPLCLHLYPALNMVGFQRRQATIELCPHNAIPLWYATIIPLSVKVSFTHVKKQNTSFYIKDAARHVVGEYHPLFRWSVSDARVHLFTICSYTNRWGIFLSQNGDSIDCRL